MALFRNKKKNRRNQPEAERGVWLKYVAWFSMSTCVVSLSLWGVMTLLSPHTLPLRHISLSGDLVHTNRQQLRAAIHNDAIGGFFSTDVMRIKGDVEALPWVHNVLVRRIWPDSLDVTVIEQRAVARWSDKALVNAQGELFVPAKLAGNEKLVLLKGPHGSSATMLNDYRRMQNDLQETGLQITRMTMNDRRAYEVALDNGITLALGRDQSVYRLQRFARIYISDLAATANMIDYIDMRYPNGFAVSWKENKAVSQGAVPAAGRGDHVKKS
jgi:cell division protein FtsQ